MIAHGLESLRHAPVPLVVLDANGRCVLANPAFRALVGGAPETGTALFAEGELSALVGRALAGEAVNASARWFDGSELGRLSGTSSAARPDGAPPRRLALQLSLGPATDDSGRITHAVVCFRDVTAELSIDRTGLERLCPVLERLPIGAMLLDDEYRILYFNPAAERIFGFRAADIVGQHPFGWITPAASQPLVTELFGRLAQGDMSASSTGENCTADGRTILCEWLNTPLHEASGRFVGILAMAQDVTQRLRAEEELRLSEERFRNLVDSFDDIVYTLDTRLMCTGAHGRFFERDGRRREIYVGLPLAGLLAELPSAAHDAAHRRAVAGERLAYEWAEESRGAGRTFHTSLAPLHDRQGQVNGIVGICRDISEIKKAQAQLLVSDRMASVGMLAAGVAHEINNPLAAVMANLDLIGREVRRLERYVGASELADLADELADAREASERVRETVRDLKVFSHAHDDEERRTLEVNVVVESVSRMAGNELRHRARLVKKLDEVPPVFANEARLSQVLLNLLLNAVQAIPDGESWNHEIQLATHHDPDAGKVVVEVRDSGCGMPREVLRRLFTPFFTTKPVGVGTGLGLSICHRIVTQMGGAIEVESEVGKGSCFRVLLPPATAEALHVPMAPSVEATPPRHVARARVLVIDDEPLIATVVKRTLVDEHDVITCASAEMALDLLGAGESFDVVLCDLMMPRMTGMDLHAEIVKRWPAYEARLVFLTGGAFTPRAREFLEHTSCTHLDKPFDAQTLRQLVASKLHGS
jgi:PAS domain S-box-containing protein